jgi:hypothetical protein
MRVDYRISVLDMYTVDYKNLNDILDLIKFDNDANRCCYIFESINPLLGFSSSASLLVKEIIKKIIWKEDCGNSIVFGFHFDNENTLKILKSVSKSILKVESLQRFFNSQTSFEYLKLKREYSGGLIDVFDYDGTFFLSVHSKQNGKIIKENFVVDGHLIPLEEYLKSRTKASTGENFDKCTNDLSSITTTFNLSLTDSQKEKKNKVVLPYTEAAQILYQYDDGDDFDEEDPDEDLEI